MRCSYQERRRFSIDLALVIVKQMAMIKERG